MRNSLSSARWKAVFERLRPQDSQRPSADAHSLAIRDIEQGKDVKLSSLQAVARALGLELELSPVRD